MSELTRHLSQLDIEPIEVISPPTKKELSLEELMANGSENGSSSIVAKGCGNCSACATLSCVPSCYSSCLPTPGCGGCDSCGGCGGCAS